MAADKILVVDDEKEIADLIEFYLKNEDYRVFKCCTGQEAIACAEREEMDLAILDIMLPDVNGYTVCGKIRENHTYPIIMLTARDEEIDKITGLSLGADDYITKPFRPLELAARVKAQLRRYKRYGRKSEIYPNDVGRGLQNGNVRGRGKELPEAITPICGSRSFSDWWGPRPLPSSASLIFIRSYGFTEGRTGWWPFCSA